MSTLLTIIAGVLLLAVASTFVLSLSASRPEGLGVENGRLAEAPDSPNCVSTQTSDRSHWIAPISFRGPADAAMESLIDVVKGMSGSSIIENHGNYLYAEFRSPFFRFTDDVEFLIEPESNRIHFRSASRVGHSDLGANRDRMEKIRSLYADANSDADNNADDARRSSDQDEAFEPAMTE